MQPIVVPLTLDLSLKEMKQWHALTPSRSEKKKRMFVETFHIAHNHHVENTYIILKVKITQANHSCQFYCGGCFALFYWN